MRLWTTSITVIRILLPHLHVVQRTSSSAAFSVDPTKLNIRYKPIEIPVFDPSKTEFLSFHDWLNIFRHAAESLPDYSMRAALLQNTLAGESKAFY